MGLFVSAFLFRSFLTSSAADIASIFICYLFIMVGLDSLKLDKPKAVLMSLYLCATLCAFLITLKASNIYLLLFLLPLFLKYYQLQQWRVQLKPVVVVALIGVCFAVPWMCRFYYTTGYIVYPYEKLDLFDPDWKIDLETVKREAQFVSYYAQVDIDDKYAAIEMPPSEWIPTWWQNQNIQNKGFFVLSILGVLHLLVFARYHLKDPFRYGALLVLAGNIGIWFFSYPAFRFGWGFILPFTFSMAVLASRQLRLPDRLIQNSLYSFVLLMTVFTGVRTVTSSLSILPEIWFTQAAFPEVAYQSIQINGVEANQADVPWDTPLPSVTDDFTKDMTLRSGELKDGFRSKP